MYGERCNLHQHSDLSRQLLARVLELLEESQSDSGSCNFLVARYAGNASRLLAFDDLALRFANLLAAVTPQQYWSGMITNIPRTNEVPLGVRELRSLTEIEAEHPLFTQDYLTKVISGNFSNANLDT